MGSQMRRGWCRSPRAVVRHHRCRCGVLWTALQVLSEAQGKVLSDSVGDEDRAAQDELDNRAIITELRRALSTGAIQVLNGKLYAGFVDLKELTAAIALTSRLRPKTNEAKLMLFSAKVIKRLREALQEGDFAEANQTLETIKGKKLASDAINEIRMAQDAVDNWVRRTRCWHGLLRRWTVGVGWRGKGRWLMTT